MKNILLALAISLLVLAVSANKPYNEEVNRVALEEKIKLYRQDLKRLRQAASDIKRRLSDNRANETYSLSALQEGMAQQRDILYNIETYLTLPFSVSRCSCYSFSQSDKDRLNQDIKNVKGRLQSLQRVVSVMPECSPLKKIKAQIRRQQQFVKVADESLNSPCCGPTPTRKNRTRDSPSGLTDVSQNTWQTNIHARNWIYGGLTESEIRLRYFSNSASQNVRNCPIETPFFSRKQGRCINCVGDFPIWDMAKESCAKCSKYHQFRPATRTCVQTQMFVTKEEEVVENPIVQKFKTIEEEQAEAPEEAEPIKTVVRKKVIKRRAARRWSKKGKGSSKKWSRSSRSRTTSGHESIAEDEQIDQ